MTRPSAPSLLNLGPATLPSGLSGADPEFDALNVFSRSPGDGYTAGYVATFEGTSARGVELDINRYSHYKEYTEDRL